MSNLGIVMLVHTALDRAEQVARFWTAAGCPVVIHVDKAVPRKRYDRFRVALSDLDLVRFSARHRCEWGSWGLVAAAQSASELILREFPVIRHVYLTSGSCLPLRPADELMEYLKQRPRTDFIESATTEDVPWTVGGLDEERFTLWFPFSWKRQRRLFDVSVALQRGLGLTRKIPVGIKPHMGSQWWCLTRQTLSAILEDPDREMFETYFKGVWIPDESYFQTLARLYSTRVESRSLTLSKFDFQGKPHIFYDDHLQLLRRSDCFMARKIWPQANKLYDRFLSGKLATGQQIEPNPGKIDRVFSKALERRTRGRAGLYMQSRFPKRDWENGVTCGPYSVFQGFSELFEDFEPWLSRVTGAQVHGNLFALDRVHYSQGHKTFVGCLGESAAQRDYDPKAFLTNLIWNTRGERQCFQFGPKDVQNAAPILANDPNAQICVISGAWAVPLFRSNRNFGDLRAQAALLQHTEAAALKVFQDKYVRANVTVWSMAEFAENPAEALVTALSGMRHSGAKHLAEMPKLVDLNGFGQFLQNLRNQGMHPYLTGDFPVDPGAESAGRPARKPYLVR